jgi:hypothetical protein
MLTFAGAISDSGDAGRSLHDGRENVCVQVPKLIGHLLMSAGVGFRLAFPF